MINFAQAFATYGQQAKEAEGHSVFDDIVNLLVKELPYGSGFDNGTTFDNDRSSSKELVFNTGFHHLNKGGYYDGWTDHTVKVTPTFYGFNVAVSGKDRNGIKEYIAETFHNIMSKDIGEDITQKIRRLIQAKYE